VYNKIVFLLLARTSQVSAAWGVWVKSKAPAVKARAFPKDFLPHERKGILSYYTTSILCLTLINFL